MSRFARSAWAVMAVLAGWSSSRNKSRGADAAAGVGGAPGSAGADASADHPDAPSVDAGSSHTNDAAADGSTGATLIVPPPQPTLDGSKIKKYVDDLTTFNGRRVDGTAAVAVDMVEFQQKVLPAAFYATLPAPYNGGTYLWGYKINGGAPSFPATTIEAKRGTATVVAYSNGLRAPSGAPLFLQRRIVTDLTIHRADPVGLTQTHECLTEPPLPAACLGIYAAPEPAVPHLHGAEVSSDFDGMPDSWFTSGLAIRGPAYVSNIV